MEGTRFLALVFFAWRCLISAVQCEECNFETALSGKIIHPSKNEYDYYIKCWKILVPVGHFIELKITDIRSWHSCQNAFLRISVAESGEEYRFCESNYTEDPIIAWNNVTISRRNDAYELNDVEFTLLYTIVSENIPIKGVREARRNAVSRLMSLRSPPWGWKENTPRAIVALYLTGNVSFNGRILEEELMAKETELRTALALLKPSLTNSELSLLVNALLVTCHNPRHFYGNDLVERLKEQVDQTQNLTHPLAYLALCNANESWPQKATADLTGILNTDPKYPFARDLQAMAIMAVSCFENNSESFNSSFDSTLYKNTIKRFKGLQLQDGSFGNVYTTAFITQALISSGQLSSGDWNSDATIHYLMKRLNSSSVDFLLTYLALPILNGKSLAHVSKINCTANPRRHGDDPITEIQGPKMRVQYSLYIGDEKDVIHTISLRVPQNYTASAIMELAAVENPKYKFEYEKTTGKMYVFQIADITNDPEHGKFWLLYVGTTNNTGSLEYLTVGPDELVMGDGDYLVMWYKTASI